ncbi:S24/S26 family peptidase [Colwellia sp. RE-S-Sl-9]
MIHLIRVNGNSMLPELANGDFVIVSTFYWSLNVGDLIVAEHPEYKSIIKRIVKLSETKGVLLSSAHQSGVSTEQIGWIPKKKIFGKVLYQFKS